MKRNSQIQVDMTNKNQITVKLPVVERKIPEDRALKLHTDGKNHEIQSGILEPSYSNQGENEIDKLFALSHVVKFKKI